MTDDYEGLVTRGLAFAVDAVVINLVAISVAGVMSLILSVLSLPDALDGVLIGIGGAAFLVWVVAYFVTFWSTTGQTPGDRVMRITVRCADGGEPPSAGRALLRMIYLALAALPLLAGFITVLFDDRRRGVHDMLAGTVVVTA